MAPLPRAVPTAGRLFLGLALALTTGAMPLLPSDDDLVRAAVLTSTSFFDFDIILTRLSSLASANAVTAVRYRVVYITLLAAGC